MSSRRLLPGLTLAALLLVPAYVSAADPPAGPTPAAKMEAAKLAGDGRKALKEKRFDEAAQALQRSADLDPNPQTRLDLAEALAGAGKLLQASRALHAVADAPPNPATTKLQEAAKKSLGAIEPRIPWLQIDVIGPDEGTAVVKVDGAEVDASNEIPLDPGEHKISATAEGFEPGKKKITIEEGVHDKKKLKLHKKGAGKSSEPKEDDGTGDGTGDGSSSGSGSGSGSGSRSSGGSSGGTSDGSPSIFSPDHPKFLSTVSFGVGGLGLVIGSITGLVAVSKASAARKFCTGTACTPAAADDISASKAAGTTSTISFIIAGVGAAAGVTLLFVLPDGKRKPDRIEKPTPAPAPVDPDEPSKPEKEAPKDTDAWIAPYIGFGHAGLRGAF